MPATTPELLDKLLRAPGPSGHEAGPARVWREGCAAFAQDVSGDHVGSSVARIQARPPGGGPTLAVIGHIDEIGVHITHIDDQGYLRFGEVGGWDPIQLVGQRVRLATRGGDVIGVIGRKPIHLITSDERDRAPKTKDLHIDIGAADVDEAREMVRVGDVGVIDAAPVMLANDRLVSRSLDNRIGCFVAAETARLVAADVRPHRAGLVRAATAITGRVGVVVADGTVPAWRPGAFDRVLADVPCSGLGALRRRPEARWRRTPADVAGLGALQRGLLASALDAARPGGVVAYVTCSPHLAETRDIVAAVMWERDDVEVLDAPALLPEVPDLRCPAAGGLYAQFWPHRHGTDGIFLALLRRRDS